MVVVLCFSSRESCITSSSQLFGDLVAIFCEYGDIYVPPPLALPIFVPARSVGLRIVVTICFLWPCEWIELFDELCFIVLLKSVDIMPTEMVELFALPTPVTWMVPDGCSAASIPFYLA